MTNPNLELSIEPWPVNSGSFQNQHLIALIDTILRLNKISPIAKVTFTQSLPSGDQPTENAHQFQIYFKDARNWVDLLETLPGADLNKPRLTRSSLGSELFWEEWDGPDGIVTIRKLALAAHNALGEPDLIQITLGTVDDAAVLHASPSSAAHGVGQFTVNWHNPLAGHHDWIALFLHTQPNNGTYVAYQYVPDGQVDGSFMFNVPNAAGAYEFRYLIADGYVEAAVSDPLTVT